MTIVQINYFLAAEAAGSLTQAAEDLGVAQPSLSEQIRRLEQQLGVSVFTRGRSGLTLTEAGRRFLPHARRVASEYAAALDSVTDIRNREAGTVAFGLFNSGPFVLAGLIPAFRARYPGISVRMVGANSAAIADAVRSGRLEAGVVALPIDARGLTIGEVIWSCEAAYFHADPEATREPVGIADLTRRPLVLPDAGFADTDPTRQQLSIRAQRLGIGLVPDIEVETGAAALSVAASGLAGAVVSVPVAEAFGYTDKLGWVSLDPPLMETFAVISRDPDHLSPGTTAMIELINEQRAELHREQIRTARRGARSATIKPDRRGALGK